MSGFIGSLNQRVTIERPATLRTAMGAQSAGWETVARCLASVVAEGAGAEAEGMALAAMSRFRVTIRSRDGIGVGQRVNWGGRHLMIRQRSDDPARPDRIALRCEEVRA